MREVSHEANSHERHCTDQARIVRANHRDDNAIFVTTLASIRCQYLDGFVVVVKMRKQLYLLSVQGDDPNLAFLYPAAKQALGNLPDEMSLRHVLH